MRARLVEQIRQAGATQERVHQWNPLGLAQVKQSDPVCEHRNGNLDPVMFAASWGSWMPLGIWILLLWLQGEMEILQCSQEVFCCLAQIGGTLVGKGDSKVKAPVVCDVVML